MKYCKECKTFFDDENNRCPVCNGIIYHVKVDPTSTNTKVEHIQDEGDFRYAFIGFIMPWLGLYLYLMLQYEKPRSAYMVLKGMITYFVMAMIIVFVFIIRSIIKG